MIKQVCVCSRCGKDEETEAYKITMEKAEVGPVNLSTVVCKLAEWHPSAHYGTHLCRKCKESFDKFMKNGNEYIVPTELMNEDVLKALAVEGCPEEFDLPQIKSVCEKAELEECVECFKKAIKLKAGEPNA